MSEHQHGGSEGLNRVRGQGREILVDTSNVAFTNHNRPGEKGSFENIEKMCDYLTSLGFKPVMIADATLRYKIDQPDRLDRLEKKNQIHQAPATTQADYFILQLAEQENLPIISDDAYRDRAREFPRAVHHYRVPFMIVDGTVVVDQERLREAERVANQDRNQRDSPAPSDPGRAGS